MQAVKVLKWVPSEPHKEVPLWLVRDALALVDVNVFWEVQAAVAMLLLLFTFARSESPCPQAYDGPRGFDPAKHLQVVDVRPRQVGGGCDVRLKGIKQDPRMERPTAAGNQDWIVIGEAPGLFSISRWLQALFRLHGGRRAPESPFFLDRLQQRVYTGG